MTENSSTGNTTGAVHHTRMNRAQKGWITRYENEIAILEERMKNLRDELYDEFTSFIKKTAKYQYLDEEHTRMVKAFEKLQKKNHKEKMKV